MRKRGQKQPQAEGRLLGRSLWRTGGIPGPVLRDRAGLDQGVKGSAPLPLPADWAARGCNQEVLWGSPLACPLGVGVEEGEKPEEAGQSKSSPRAPPPLGAEAPEPVGPEPRRLS